MWGITQFPHFNANRTPLRYSRSDHCLIWEALRYRLTRANQQSTFVAGLPVIRTGFCTSIKLGSCGQASACLTIRCSRRSRLSPGWTWPLLQSSFSFF